MSTPQPRGQMIDVGDGRRLHLVRAGPVTTIGPAVLLEAGAFGFSADWAAVQEILAGQAVRSLAYDRAGLGFSDPGPAPRDSLAVAKDLEILLRVAGEDGPLVLCGHSMAGLHVRLFASRNRVRVAGIVLVDATTPEAMDVPLTSQMVEHFGRFSQLAAWGARMGLFRPLARTRLGDAIGLEGAPGVEKRWAFALASHNHWAAEEVVQWPASAEQARRAETFDPAWPVAVVLAGHPHGLANLSDVQTAPARASRSGFIESAAGASHATVLSGAYARAVVRGIDHVLGKPPLMPAEPAQNR